MEEKRQEETKEVTIGILDIKREERRTEAHNSTDNNKTTIINPALGQGISLVDSYLHPHPHQHLAS